jgi:hypothetical protein
MMVPSFFAGPGVSPDLFRQLTAPWLRNFLSIASILVEKPKPQLVAVQQ